MKRQPPGWWMWVWAASSPRSSMVRRWQTPRWVPWQVSRVWRGISWPPCGVASRHCAPPSKVERAAVGQWTSGAIAATSSATNPIPMKWTAPVPADVPGRPHLTRSTRKSPSKNRRRTCSVRSFGLKMRPNPPVDQVSPNWLSICRKWRQRANRGGAAAGTWTLTSHHRPCRPRTSSAHPTGADSSKQTVPTITWLSWTTITVRVSLEFARQSGHCWTGALNRLDETASADRLHAFVRRLRSNASPNRFGAKRL